MTADSPVHFNRRAGSANGRARLTEQDVAAIRERARDGETGAAIARELGMYPGSVQRIIAGKRWSEKPLPKTTPQPRPSVEDRFWASADRSGGPDACWPWQRYLTHGYGRFFLNGRREVAPRVAWLLAGHALDPSLTIDHLCRNTRCVNPAHLELVTMRENVLRGTSPAAQLSRRLACKQGHPYTPENIRWRGTTRVCKTCEREHSHRDYITRRKVAQHG